LLIRNVEKENEELEKREARFLAAEQKRRQREDEVIERARKKQEAIAKRIQDRKDAAEARRASVLEERERRREARRMERDERRRLKKSKSAEQRAKERGERNRKRVLTPREKQTAAKMINEGRSCTQRELALAIREKVPEKPNVVINEFVQRAAERRKTKASGKKKVWQLKDRYELMMADEWVQEQEARPKDAYVPRKDGVCEDKDVPVLLRLIQIHGEKLALDELVELAHNYILFVTDGRMKAKIREIAVKDKRLGQKRKQWNILPQFLPMLSDAPQASTLPEIRARTRKAWLNHDEDEADCFDDESSDEDSLDSTSEEESDGEYEFIQKNGPKKPPSSYIYFSNLNRKRVGLENPTLKNTEVTKKLGEMWREMGKEEKDAILKDLQVLKDKYKAEYKIFEKTKLKEWKKTHPDSSDDESSSEDEKAKGRGTKKGRKRRKLNPLQQFLKKNQPKKPNSAYILFCTQHRNEVKTSNPELKSSQIMIKLAGLWKEVGAEEKAKFELLSNEMKEQYKKDILDFETGPKAEFIRNNPGCNAKIESSSDEDSSSEDDSSDDDEPKKRKVLSPEQQFIKKNKPKNPVSAYIIFCSENREAGKKGNPGITGPNLMKQLGAKWKVLTAEDKVQYQEKAKALREQYNKDWKAFQEGPLAKWREENKDKLDENKKPAKKRKVVKKTAKKEGDDDENKGSVGSDKQPGANGTSNSSFSSSSSPTTKSKPGQVMIA